MLKYLVLFLVVAVVSVKESNATSQGLIIWVKGSTVNATFGPEDAVYCKLKDAQRTTVYEGFGQCRVVLDRVTLDHKGYWELFVADPVIVRSSSVYVDVVAKVPSTPVVETSVVRQQTSVVLTCSVPKDVQVQRCTFRNPYGTILVATSKVNQDGLVIDAPRYETVAEDHNCRLTLMEPHRETPGTWRCDVDVKSSTAHGFLKVQTLILDPENPSGSYSPLPKLETNYNIVSRTEGEPVLMSCSINAPIRYCYFRSPNGTVFNVGPSTSSADYEYVGKGFDAGECGIRFHNVLKSDQGYWSCSVGLNDTLNFVEQRDSFEVYVSERMLVNHRWEGQIMVIRARVLNARELEYCRYVRSDGFGFVAGHEPSPYFSSSTTHGVCELYIERPEAADFRPWTVVAKIPGADEELTMTTTLEPRPQTTGGRNRTASTIFWCLLGTFIVFMILGSILPRKNRDWTRQRAVLIRNSFRRQPTAPPQNVAAPQPPVHVDILTDLPRKV